jgi:hypothetical protein
VVTARADDPNAEVDVAYRVKERLRDFYRTSETDEARAMVKELQERCLTRACYTQPGPTGGCRARSSSDWAQHPTDSEVPEFFERKTGFEPATLTLAR